MIVDYGLRLWAVRLRDSRLPTALRQRWTGWDDGMDGSQVERIG